MIIVHHDGSKFNTSGLGRSDEFKEYLLKEIAILKLENDRYRNQSFGYERKRKPLSEDAKFVGSFSMGFEKTWDLFEFQFRYHFGPRFDNSDLISSLKGDALIYLQRTDPNGNKTAEENLVQLRKHYQDLPTTLLLKFSEFTRTGKFESLERLLLVFDTVRTRAKLSDDAAIVTLKTALGMNFSKALMVDISDLEGYTSFQKFSEKIVRLEKNYQLTMDSNNNNIQTSSTHNNNSNKDNQQSPLDNNNNHNDNNKSRNNNNKSKVKDIVKFNKYSIELLEKIDFSPQPYQKEIVTLPRPDIDFKVAQDSSIILTPQQAKFVQLKKNYTEIIPEKLKKESLAKEIYHSIPFIDGTEESKLHQAPYPVSAVINYHLISNFRKKNKVTKKMGTQRLKQSKVRTKL
ncbi:hypothetical protein DICPUDRAFT_160533, partial [Dictyostelium purpureum]